MYEWIILLWGGFLLWFKTSLYAGAYGRHFVVKGHNYYNRDFADKQTMRSSQLVNVDIELLKNTQSGKSRIETDNV